MPGNTGHPFGIGGGDGQVHLEANGTVLLSLFVLTIVAFLLAQVIPGDPARVYVGSAATPAEVQAAAVHLGLNRPLVVQYGEYLWRLLHGNFGISVFSHRPIALDLQQVLPPSLELVFAAMLIDIVIGIPLGVVAAARSGGFVDGVTRLFSMTGSGIPPFFLAVVLQYLVCFRLGILPLSGEFSSSITPTTSITGFPLLDTLLVGHFATCWNGIEHLVPPAFCLALGFSGVIMRTVRSSMIGALGEDYIVLAYAKGLRERRVLVRHALRTALLPSLTIMGMQIGWILGSTVLVESVFTYPGIGNYAVNALFQSDLWAVVAVVLVVGAAFVVGNFLTDVVQMLLDPQVRAQRLGIRQ